MAQFKAIDNLALMWITRISLFVVMGIAILPFFLHGFDVWYTIPSIILGLGLILLFWLATTPSYFCIEEKGGFVFLSTDKEEEDSFYLQLEAKEILDYEIVKTFGGFKKHLYFYKRGPGGIMRSKPLNVSISTPGMERKIVDSLSPYRKTSIAIQRN